MRITIFVAHGYNLEEITFEAMEQLDQFLTECPHARMTGVVSSQTLLGPQIEDEVPEFYHVITITYVNTDMPT